MSCLMADYMPLPLKAILLDILRNVWLTTENSAVAPAIRSNAAVREFLRSSFEAMSSLFVPVAGARDTKGLHKLGSAVTLGVYVDEEGELVQRGGGVEDGRGAGGEKLMSPDDIMRWRKLQFAELSYVFRSLLPCARAYFPQLDPSVREHFAVMRGFLGSLHSLLVDGGLRTTVGSVASRGWASLLSNEEADAVLALTTVMRATRALVEGREGLLGSIEAVARQATAADGSAPSAVASARSQPAIDRRGRTRDEAAHGAPETKTAERAAECYPEHLGGCVATEPVRARVHPLIIASGYGRFLALLDSSASLTSAVEQQFNSLVDAVVAVETRVRDRVPLPGVTLLGGSIRRIRMTTRAPQGAFTGSSPDDLRLIGSPTRSRVSVLPLVSHAPSIAAEDLPVVTFDDLMRRFGDYSRSRRAGMDVTILTTVFRIIRRLVDMSPDQSSLRKIQTQLQRLGIVDMVFTQLCIARRQPLVCGACAFVSAAWHFCSIHN